jgi:enoyl-[acyl-carrier protein] reductase/trans-2-enoyl-CoA reductase (NAD+)
MGSTISPNAAELLLGGSNGMARAPTAQLLFGEKAHVHRRHFDSETSQIGGFYVQVLSAAAESLHVKLWNDDATTPVTIEAVIDEHRGGVRPQSLVNELAAGASKRHAEHGPAFVKDIDVAFDLVVRVPDFSKPEKIRRVVEVEVPTDVHIERTDRFMGSSSLLWAEPFVAAGLLVRGESIGAFRDNDYPPDDPVDAMGPLVAAKQLHRQTMSQVSAPVGARTARLCYPPIATPALGAIPGGLLTCGLSAQLIKERGRYRDVMEFGHESTEILGPSWDLGELYLDEAHEAAVPESQARKARLAPGLRGARRGDLGQIRARRVGSHPRRAALVLQTKHQATDQSGCAPTLLGWAGGSP